MDLKSLSLVGLLKLRWDIEMEIISRYWVVFLILLILLIVFSILEYIIRFKKQIKYNLFLII